MSQAVPVAVSRPTDQSAAVTASFLGWTLDAFDYFLVVYCLTAIGSEFHRSDAQMALSITVTLAFRPVGAFLFGLMADRYGRRLPLMIDLIFYSVVEVATGFAPGYTSFIILRALFGIGMGGEWGVGASLAMEKVSPKFRGLVSGILQQGYALGNLLAALCYFFLFKRFGWRPMFFIGGLPALLALFIRVRVKESEVWEKTRKTDWRDLTGAILSQLEALPLSDAADGLHELRLARHAGHVPHVPAALLAFRRREALADLRVLRRRRHLRRHHLRLLLRFQRTPPRHRDRPAAGHRHDPALGSGAECAACSSPARF